MTSREFILNSKKFERRRLTTLQHKLKVVLKCYTITNFHLNEQDNSFTFNKSYMKNGIRMNDPRGYNGNYEFEQIDEQTCKVRINVI